jgi:hypothetical protein
MFVRLTRPARAKAGRFAALLYLFCVLAPGVALALGDAASCLLHQPTTATEHVHTGDQADAAAHQHHGQHAMQDADAGHALPAPAGHQHDGKGATGPCCAMLCVSAIAAELPAIAKPAVPVSTCVSENFRRLPQEAPPLLFRPPIA